MTNSNVNILINLNAIYYYLFANNIKTLTYVCCSFTLSYLGNRYKICYC